MLEIACGGRAKKPARFRCLRPNRHHRRPRLGPLSEQAKGRGHKRINPTEGKAQETDDSEGVAAPDRSRLALPRDLLRVGGGAVILAPLTGCCQPNLTQ